MCCIGCLLEQCMVSEAQTWTQRRGVGEHCLAGNAVEWTAGQGEQASGGSMQFLEAQLRLFLL